MSGYRDQQRREYPCPRCGGSGVRPSGIKLAVTAEREAREERERLRIVREFPFPGGLVASDRQVSDAVYLLQTAAQISIPELNPDGEDQAAHSLRLAIVEALTVLDASIPQQRQSMEQ